MQAGQMMDMVVANVIRIQGCLAFFCYYSTTQPANGSPLAPSRCSGSLTSRMQSLVPISFVVNVAGKYKVACPVLRPSAICQLGCYCFRYCIINFFIPAMYVVQAVLCLHGSLTTRFSKQHGLFWYSHLSIQYYRVFQLDMLHFKRLLGNQKSTFKS